MDLQREEAFEEDVPVVNKIKLDVFDHKSLRVGGTFRMADDENKMFLLSMSCGVVVTPWRA